MARRAQAVMLAADLLLRFISGVSGARHTACVQGLFRATRRVSFRTFAEAGQPARIRAAQALMNRYAKSSA
jgi:hypothetical protein